MKQPAIFMRGEGFNPFTPLPICRFMRAPVGVLDEALRIHTVPLASMVVLPPKERFDEGPYEEGEWDAIEPWKDFGVGPPPVVSRDNRLEDLAIDAPNKIVGTSLEATFYIKCDGSHSAGINIDTLIGDGKMFDVIIVPMPKWDKIELRYARNCKMIKCEMGRNMLTVVLRFGV